MPTTWGADWDYFGTADRCRHTLYPCPCRLQEASIITAKKIFDTKLHLYQIYATAILKELRQFFFKCQGNHIEFWECPSRLKWNLHKSADRDLKEFNPIPILPSKISWDFSSIRWKRQTILWSCRWQFRNHRTVLHQRGPLAPIIWTF